MKPGFIEKISSELNGMCGGNVNSDLWFCGIEWANWPVNDTIQNELFSDEYYAMYNKVKVKLPCVTEAWAAHHLLGHPFDKKIARVVLAWKSYSEKTGAKVDEQGIMDYITSKVGNESDKQDLGLYRRWGDIFKLNLFPLHERNVRTWKKVHSENTGCLLKSEYYTYCIEHRFPIFRELVLINNPKVIVCIGRQFIKEFILAFWGEKGFTSNNKNSEIEIVSPKYSIELPLKPKKDKPDKSALQIQIYCNEDKSLPILIGTPFFSDYPSCVNSPDELDKIGEIIANIFPYKSNLPNGICKCP
ncbi:MAG: hypothetical protein U0264_01835 [Candidatus Kapaibacterium sp.]